jgi:hypothetical protein
MGKSKKRSKEYVNEGGERERCDSVVAVKTQLAERGYGGIRARRDGVLLWK